MATKREYHYDQSLILILSAHIFIHVSVSGITNITADSDGNINYTWLNNSRIISHENISDEIYIGNQLEKAPNGTLEKVPNGTFNRENGSDIINEVEDKRQIHHQKSVFKIFKIGMCNFTEQGSNCTNSTNIVKGEGHPLSSRPISQNISHVNISANIFKYVNEKTKSSHFNTTLHESAVTSELETGNTSSDAFLQNNNMSVLNITENIEYEYETERTESTSVSQIGTDSTENYTGIVGGHTKLKDEHHRKHIKRRTSIWQNKHYIRSVVVPVTCGIIGALALVCVGYALRSCPTNALYINDYETFKVEDDSVVVNDRLMLLVDSSDEEV